MFVSFKQFKTSFLNKPEVSRHMSKTYKKAEMVDWYDPRQLLDTARKTFISTTIGENADPRLVAASTANKNPFDYTQKLDKNGLEFTPNGDARDEIWIDYVADVGDGFNSTYGVAYYLAQRELDIGGERLKRGEILILGGDAVYPTAVSEKYEQQLVEPYKMAFRASETVKTGLPNQANLEEEPHIFALPGNHDWYDSLVAFQELFCTYFYNNRVFADAWRTRQDISYFALKLPHNWWLLGVDLQLSHNVDTKQLEFLEKIIRDKMSAGDKVILCVPEPYWVKAIKYQDVTDEFEEKEKSIEKLEEFLRKKDVKIKAYIAGDLHHYRRFEAGDGSGVQKVTAGGGGAFLHPTHDHNFTGRDRKNKSKGFNWKKNYPSARKSQTLDWQNLFLFGWNNKTFGILTAILYAFVAWLVHGRVEGKLTLTGAIHASLNQLVNQPLATLTIIFMLLALAFFTDTNSKIYKWVGGILHGLAHLGAIFLLGWLGYYISLLVTRKDSIDPNDFTDNLTWLVCVTAVSLIGGYFIGAFIMGVYLFVSLHIFGRHDNEAFSALKIEDYKNFLRLHIDKNGNLTIYPIKIEKVARKWKEVRRADNEISHYTPQDGTKPDLIEKIPPVI
jgi:Calcineurin-like phosphoesterase